MISIPILQLPVGEPVEVMGPGGTTPGGDDTVLGGEAFLGMLQQLLLGGAVQLQPGQAPSFERTAFAATGPPSAGTSAGPPAHGPEPSAILPQAAGILVQASEASAVIPPGSSAAPVTGEPAQDRPHAPAAPPQETPSRPGPTPVAAMPLEEEVAAVMGRRQGIMPVPAELLRTLSEEDREFRDPAAGRPGVPKPASDTSGRGETRQVVQDTQTADRQATIRRSTVQQAAAKALFTPPNIPASRMERDLSSGRMQETAPERHDAAKSPAVVPAAEGPSARQAVRVPPGDVVLQLEVSPSNRTTPAPVPVEAGGEEPDAVPARERTTETVKPLPAGQSQAHNGEGRESAGHRSPFIPTEVPPAAVKGDHGAIRQSFRVPEFVRTLPPETAQNVVDQVVKVFALHVQGDTSEVRITLEPESLGEVVLHVRMEQGKMQAQIDVTQAAVKAVLDQSIGQLRQSLLTRGIDVQRLDVSVGGDSFMQESGGGGDRSSRQRTRREVSPDAVEQYQTGRLLGYNTMELVM